MGVYNQDIKVFEMFFGRGIIRNFIRNFTILGRETPKLSFMRLSISDNLPVPIPVRALVLDKTSFF